MAIAYVSINLLVAFGALVLIHKEILKTETCIKACKTILANAIDPNNFANPLNIVYKNMKYKITRKSLEQLRAKCLDTQIVFSYILITTSLISVSLKELIPSIEKLETGWRFDVFQFCCLALGVVAFILYSLEFIALRYYKTNFVEFAYIIQDDTESEFPNHDIKHF